MKFFDHMELKILTPEHILGVALAEVKAGNAGSETNYIFFALHKRNDEISI